MDLFEKIVTQRITSPGQLSEAEQAIVAADPGLAQLIEQNAEFAGVSAKAPLEPQLAEMLHRVRLAESISRPPAAGNLLEQLFGQGWLLKAAGSMAAVAVLALALFAIPQLLSGNPEPQLIAQGPNQQVLQAAMNGVSYGTWLEYSVDGEMNGLERELLHEKLQLSVADSSSSESGEPVVRLLADGSAYSVYVPNVLNTDERIDRIDSAVRRVERFSLASRSNRLYVDGAVASNDIRLIDDGHAEIAFPVGMSGEQLLLLLETVAPQLPELLLPRQHEQIASLVHDGFSAAGRDGNWLAIEDTASGGSLAQPGISEDDIRAIEDFEKLELRLGNRLENSLALYQLDESQIEKYRRDLEHELELHLLLPSNWNSMQRSELDDYVYRQLLMQCRAMGIDTVDIDREQIAVYVNDEDADSEQLPREPHRLTVEIR